MNEPEKIPERRRFIRLSKSLTVRYTHIGEIKNDEEFVGKNISTGGLCVILKEPLSAQSLLNLRVYLPDNTLPIRIKGKVAWSRQLSLPDPQSSLFQTGIEFIEIDELDFKKINKYVNDNQMKTQFTER